MYLLVSIPLPTKLKSLPLLTAIRGPTITKNNNLQICQHYMAKYVQHISFQDTTWINKKECPWKWKHCKYLHGFLVAQNIEDMKNQQRWSSGKPILYSFNSS